MFSLLTFFSKESKLVLIRARVHPFPFRTRKLSSLLPKILVWRRTGKIGNANTKDEQKCSSFFFLSGLSLVEEGKPEDQCSGNVDWHTVYQWYGKSIHKGRVPKAKLMYASVEREGHHLYTGSKKDPQMRVLSRFSLSCSEGPGCRSWQCSYGWQRAGEAPRWESR